MEVKNVIIAAVAVIITVVTGITVVVTRRKRG